MKMLHTRIINRIKSYVALCNSHTVKSCSSQLAKMLIQSNFYYWLIPADENDFDASSLNSFFIPMGATPGSGFTPVNVNIIDDMIFEKNHEFNVAITDAEDRVNIGVPSTTTVTIVDNESR